mmetsp:Transcript_15837/g.63813  ORF Transcript_15837/g.63813 Transcript_15837/m.63813 type:complete len:215 (-) Transcript_15837:95-739(-)
MERDFDDLLHSGHRDAEALLSRERVLRRFEVDEGPFAERARLELGLEADRRLRVRGEVAHDPREVARLGFAAFDVPELLRAEEVREAEADPGEPDEVLLGVDDVEDEPAEDVEALAVDDALVRRELDAAGPLLAGNDERGDLRDAFLMCALGAGRGEQKKQRGGTSRRPLCVESGPGRRGPWAGRRGTGRTCDSGSRAGRAAAAATRRGRRGPY